MNITQEQIQAAEASMRPVLDAKRNDLENL